MQIETLSINDTSRLEYWQEQWLALFREQTSTDFHSSYQWLANDFINLKKARNRRCYIAHDSGVFKGAMVCEPQWYKLGQRLPVPIVNTGSHFVNDFAIDDIDGSDTLAALVKAVQIDFPHSAWINFEKITQSCFQHFQAFSTTTHSALLTYADDHSAVFDVSSGDFSLFTQSMSSKSKANLRYYERLLIKSLGPVVHEVISKQSAEDMDFHFSQFLEIEKSGWKGGKGTSITQLEDSKNFHYSLCEAAAKQGQLRWYKLYAGNQLVAMNMAIQRAADLWVVKTAYDENSKQFSPGTVGITKLLNSAVEDLEICRVRMITSYSWLDRWHPNKEIYHGARIFNRNLLGILFYNCLNIIQQLRSNLMP
jgi:hypothetical protein